MVYLSLTKGLDRVKVPDKVADKVLDKVADKVPDKVADKVLDKVADNVWNPILMMRIYSVWMARRWRTIGSWIVS